MSERPVCSYEGSRYSTEFWDGSRAYEDGVERVALRALVPPTGRTLIEIGAGHGRLVDLYQGYDTVVLLDYARTQLEQAVARLGNAAPGGSPRYLFVQADFYRLPFVGGLFDAVTMIRTLHHAVDPPSVIQGVSEILAPDGAFVLEFANKHNLKALLRYLMRRQDWSPFERAPVEFVDLNFNFHPRWIWNQLERAGLTREGIRTVSHFRVDILKRLLPTSLLLRLDALAQPTGALWQWSPSVFVRSRASAGKQASADDAFFACPGCGTSLGTPGRARYLCSSCGASWQCEGQIYNFRDAIADT